MCFLVSIDTCHGGRIVLHDHRKARDLRMLSTGTSWKKKKWQKWTPLGEFLLVLLGHIKSLYTSGIENPIETPWLRGGFHDSVEDGTVSAVAERSIYFWWCSVLRSPCKSDLPYFLFIFFLIGSLYSLAIAILVVIHSAVQMSNLSCRSEALLTLCL